MSTPESKLWNRFREALPHFCHAERIENSLERGTPDVHLCYQGKDIYVELKVQRENRNFIRKEQAIWIKRRNQEGGGHSHVLIFNDDIPIFKLYTSPLEFAEGDGKYRRILSSPHTFNLLESVIQALLS